MSLNKDFNVTFKYFMLAIGNKEKEIGKEELRMEASEKALEAGPLERLFGGAAIIKILDFLILFREWDYSKTDIAKNSGVSFRHVLRALPKLEKYGLIMKTRQVGRASLYKINMENPIAKALHELAFQIAVHDAEKTTKEKIRKEKKEIIVASSPNSSSRFNEGLS